MRSESEKLYDNQANVCVDKNGSNGLCSWSCWPYFAPDNEIASSWLGIPRHPKAKPVCAKYQPTIVFIYSIICCDSEISLSRTETTFSETTNWRISELIFYWKSFNLNTNFLS